MKKLLLLLLISGSSFAQTMQVKGTNLYDYCGERVVLRGVNNMVVWTDWTGTPKDGLPAFQEIAKTGANSVRIVWDHKYGKIDEMERAIKNAIDNKLIPVVELHNMTCKWDLKTINEMTQFWVSAKDVLKKYQKWVIINYANEGGTGSTTKIEYTKQYLRQMSLLRQAGLNMPIMFDAPSCGMNIDILQESYRDFYINDPRKNILLSIHLWWNDPQGKKIKAELKESFDKKIPLVIGEFASEAFNNKIAYKTIMKEANKYGYGYYAWSWGPKNTAPIHDMTFDGKYGNFRKWGKDVVKDIKKTSIRPYSLIHGKCRGK